MFVHLSVASGGFHCRTARFTLRHGHRKVSEAPRQGDVLSGDATGVLITTDDGIALSVADYGDPAADRTVVLLHGMCLSRSSWSSQVDHLRQRFGDAVRVICIDHRGHGASQAAPASTYRIERLAADLSQVLAALNVGGKVTLVGHSMGGMVALSFLTGEADSRHVDVDALVLVASAGGHLAQCGLGRLLDSPGLSACCGLLGHVPGAGAWGLPLGAVLRRLGAVARADYRAAATVAAEALTRTTLATAVGFLPALRSFDLYPALGGVRARTLVVSGGADLLTPPAHADELVARIPGARHLRVPEGGHMLPQQAAGVVNAAIEEALGGGRRFAAAS